jgi:hypothetical protein
MTARLLWIFVGKGATFRLAISTWSDRFSLVAATQPSVAWRISW